MGLPPLGVALIQGCCLFCFSPKFQDLPWIQGGLRGAPFSAFPSFYIFPPQNSRTYPGPRGGSEVAPFMFFPTFFYFSPKIPGLTLGPEGPAGPAAPWSPEGPWEGREGGGFGIPWEMWDLGFGIWGAGMWGLGCRMGDLGSMGGCDPKSWHLRGARAAPGAR